MMSMATLTVHMFVLMMLLGAAIGWVIARSFYKDANERTTPDS